MTEQLPTVNTSSAATDEAIASNGSSALVESPTPVDYRLIKLIAVGLKEASMDTPTFRASVNYLDSEARKVEVWLRDLLKVLSQFKEFQVSLSSFGSVLSSAINSPCSRSGLINNQNTLCSLQATSTGLKSFYDTLLTLFVGDFESFSQLEQIINQDLVNYYDLRRQFEYIQHKFDAFEAKYNAQLKSKSPDSVKGDAFQLFELRKQYIHISIELWIAIIQLDIRISSELSEISYKLWGENSNLPPSITPGHRETILNILNMSKEFDLCRTSAFFTKLQVKSYKTMMQDLTSTGKDSEKGAIELFTPSDDILSYDSAVINTVNLYIEGSVPASEKHGWVYMKSKPLNSSSSVNVVGKDGYVWVKRWLFIKDDLLGLLSLSPNGRFVQESDKFGVLLCNIRYAPEEDRRLCFEIKTYQITLVFQASSLAELRAWMTVFRAVKMEALQNSNNESASSPAKNKIPPLIEQFALTPMVAKDHELVTRDTNNMINIRSVMEYEFEHTFNVKDVDAALNCVNFRVPMHTEMTKYACYSYAFMSPTSVPNAITANTWGFINWGMYYLVSNTDLERLNKNLQKNNQVSSSTDADSEVTYHSLSSYLHDLEMKAIFQYSVEPNEYILFDFECLWSPNDGQELAMNIFVSKDRLYSVLFDYGFISLRPMFLSGFLHCTLEDKGLHALVRVYTVNGFSIKFKMLASKGKIIKDKINCCITNLSSKQPKNAAGLMAQLAKIDEVHTTVEKQANLAIPLQLQEKSNEKSSLVTVANYGGDSTDNFNSVKEMKLLSSRVYDVPAKALFHILAGDNSNLLSSVLPFGALTDGVIRALPWRCDSQQVLRRRVWYDGLPGYSTFQTIDKMEYNKYYSLHQKTAKLFTPLNDIARIDVRILIVSIDSKSAKFLVHYNIERENNDLHPVLGAVYNQILSYKEDIMRQILAYKADILLDDVSQRVNTVIRDKRKVASAVKIYGPVTKYDSDEPTVEELDFYKSEIRIRLSTLSDFLVKKSIKQLGVDTTFVIGTVKNVFHWLLMFVTNNSTILAIMLLSLLLNFYLLGKTTSAYWTAKNTESYIEKIVSEPKVLERAVYLKDLETYFNQKSTISFNPANSSCFQKFKENSVVYESVSSHEEANQLQDSPKYMKGSNSNINAMLLELGIKRNELIVQLDLVSKAEKDIIASEWKDWIFFENKRCHEAQAEITRRKEIDPIAYNETYDNLQEYCQSAEMELIHIYRSLI